MKVGITEIILVAIVVIMMFIVSFIKKIKQDARNKKQQNPESMRCTSYGESIIHDTKFGHRGEKSGKTCPKSRICPNPKCKTTGIPDDAKFCPTCGCELVTLHKTRKILIKRPWHYSGCVRKAKIKIDGIIVDMIGAGKEIELEIPTQIDFIEVEWVWPFDDLKIPIKENCKVIQLNINTITGKMTAELYS